MRALGVTLLVLLLMARDASGQEVTLQASASKHSFSSPLGIGIESLRLRTMALGGVVPVAPWVSLGGTLRYGSASMALAGGGVASLEGLADSEVFAQIGFGAFSVTTSALVPTGESRLAPESVAVAAVTGYELFNLPSLFWGGGGRFGGTMAVDFGVRESVVRLEAGVSRYRGFTALVNEPFPYRPGTEGSAGLTVSTRVGFLTSLIVSGRVRFFDADQTSAVEVYRAGPRIDLSAIMTLGMGQSGILISGGLHRRAAGEAIDRDLVDPYDVRYIPPGVTDTPGRTLGFAHVDTRTPLQPFDLVSETRLRAISVEDLPSWSWLGSIGLGIERDVGLLLGGRAYLHPILRLSAGRALAAERYESRLFGWEVEVTTRWEGRE